MSGTAEHHEMIIVRRHEEEEHAHHSSAWKVAHADFMTAMMAFFLVMWLINVTDDEVRKGISQYFNPIHLSTGSADMKGLNAPGDAEGEKGKKVGHSESPADINPMQLTAGHADPIALSEAEKALAEAKAAAEAAANGAGGAGMPGKGGEKAPGAAGPAAGAAMEASDGGAGDPAATPAAGAAGGPEADARERAAFRDPYAILAQLSEKYALDHPASVDAIAADDRPVGVTGGEVDRDPFDPVYWQVQPPPPTRSDKGGDATTAEIVAPDATPDAQAAAAVSPDTPVPPDGAAPIAAMSEAAPVEASNDTVAPTAATEAAAATPPAAVNPPPPAAMKAAEPPPAPATTKTPDAVAADTLATSEAVEKEIATSIQKTVAADASPDVTVKATSEGVLINLTDDAAFSMFGVGSAIPDPQVVVLMEKIARILGEKEGDVVVRGYTDGRPFHTETYDNWRLSAARAHMAYYMLVRGGFPEKRIVSVEGHADRNLKNPDDPYAAENRRIEILLKEPGE